MCYTNWFYYICAQILLQKKVCAEIVLRFIDSEMKALMLFYNFGVNEQFLSSVAVLLVIYWFYSTY